MGVPVAIVLAGGLIAAALYFGGGGPSTPAGGQVAGNNVANAPLPQETVGAFRPVGPDDHVRGPADARVTILEYSDLECPFCKRFHPVLQQAADEFPADVRWVYRHFPLEQLHSKAPKEAEAAECAGEQGKFWEFIDLVFEVTPGNDGLDLSQLPELAAQAGVANVPQFAACLESGTYADRVAADLADATAAGGRGTPYTIIIGPDGQTVPLPGAVPYAQVKAQIEQLL